MAFRRRVLIALLVVVGGVVSVACGGDDATQAVVPDDFTAEDCVVWVHGRSERGAAPLRRDGHAVVSPDANEPYSGGGRVWIYDSPESADDARAAVISMADDVGCQRIVLHGFSNGGAYVAKLVCDGEDLDGRLIGAVIDDPVPDDSSPDCAPHEEVEVALYWTGGLTEAVVDASCVELGWTCAGSDRLVGIDEFAERLGVPVQASPHTEHVAFRDAPELTDWFAAG